MCTSACARQLCMPLVTFSGPSVVASFHGNISESTDVGERGKELRQLWWWRLLKKEEPGMMSVKQCEPWDETQRETDACVVSERAVVCVCVLCV